MTTDRSGIGNRNRLLLDRLHQLAKGPFTATQVATMLSIEPNRARRLVVVLANQGWLSRIRRGLYTLVPLGASVPKDWREDPWLVAETEFAPCYISGWSACEHWGLTEQIFADVVVVTAAPLREWNVIVQGTRFKLKSTAKAKFYGTKSVWRNAKSIQVADPSRVLVDILDDPSIGGGIKHVAEVITNYFESEHRSDSLLLDYANRFGNRTVFKRLGHIVESLGIEAPALLEECSRKLSAGLSILDPTGPKQSRIQKKWRLRVNVEISRSTPS